jgi:hypothetical protein
MTATEMTEVGALGEAVGKRALSAGDDAALDEAVRRLVAAAGDSLQGIVFFGSRRTGAARTNVWSAYDLFVLVESYRPFYERARRAGLSGKDPALMSAVSRWLPPTQFSLRLEPPGLHVKAAVIRLDTFSRETSPRRRDHFCIGRLFQPTRILYARDAETRGHILAALVSAHEETWGWVRPWLPERFDAEAYGLAALRVSMSWEVRPEPAGRADVLWAVQREEQLPVFEALLASIARRGDVVPAGGAPPAWAAPGPVRWRERVRLGLYFRWSLVRATTRWLKHTVSFEGWLDYILHKANRHSGEPAQLTDRERRWPWIFLWGRLFRYLRRRDQPRRAP